MTVTFMIVNAQKEFLGQSKCLINGLPAKNIRNEVFMLDSLPAPPYDVDISCEGYLPSHYKQVPRLSQSFSLRKADQTYYYKSFFQVAAVHDTGIILVYMNATNGNGQTWSPVDAKTKLEEQASQVGLQVVHSYYTPYSYKDNMPNESKYDFLFIVAPDTTNKVIDKNQLLRTVRNFESVSFAGLAFTEDKSYLSPIAYMGRITVQFSSTIDSGSIRRMLTNAGYSQFKVQHGPECDYYFIDFPERIGENLNTDIEKIIPLSGVTDIDAELWRPTL